MGELDTKLDRIESLIAGEKDKPKKFKLPFKAKVSNGKAKKGYVGVLKINENGVITPSKEPIEEQTIMVDGVPRLANPDYVLKWKVGTKTLPIMILPSWSVKPFSPSEDFKRSLSDGSNTAGYKLLLNRMKLSTVEDKKKTLGKLGWIFGAIVIGIIGYALISGGL
jgi:hypothetical protein